MQAYIDKFITTKGTQIFLLISGKCNVFLVCGSKNILVDTGLKRHYGIIEKRLKLLGIDCIDYLFLTHSHYDHTENAERIKSNFGAKVIIQNNESDFLRSGITKIPAGTNFFTKTVVKLAEVLQFKLNYKPCEPDIIFKNEFIFDVMDAYIIHTPGHSAGSASLILDSEFAFTGDTTFGRFKNTTFPIYCDDTYTMLQSWKKLLETECKLFFAAHGKVKTATELKHCLEYQLSL